MGVQRQRQKREFTKLHTPILHPMLKWNDTEVLFLCIIFDLLSPDSVVWWLGLLTFSSSSGVNSSVAFTMASRSSLPVSCKIAPTQKKWQTKLKGEKQKTIDIIKFIIGGKNSEAKSISMVHCLQKLVSKLVRNKYSLKYVPKIEIGLKDFAWQANRHCTYWFGVLSRWFSMWWKACWATYARRMLGCFNARVPHEWTTHQK